MEECVKRTVCPASAAFPSPPGHPVLWPHAPEGRRSAVTGNSSEEQAPTPSGDGPPGKPRSDINDVARLARVSRQTVSNVLNNRSGYSEDTRARVLRAIDELDYQPHRAARSLRSQRTMQLGYHMPSEQLAAENAFVLGFIHALVRAAADRGHQWFGYVGYDGKNYWGLERLEGFRKGLADHGIRVVEGSIVQGATLAE